MQLRLSSMKGEAGHCPAAPLSLFSHMTADHLTRGPLPIARGVQKGCHNQTNVTTNPREVGARTSQRNIRATWYMCGAGLGATAAAPSCYAAAPPAVAGCICGVRRRGAVSRAQQGEHLRQGERTIQGREPARIGTGTHRKRLITVQVGAASGGTGRQGASQHTQGSKEALVQQAPLLHSIGPRLPDDVRRTVKIQCDACPYVVIQVKACNEQLGVKHLQWRRRAALLTSANRQGDRPGKHAAQQVRRRPGGMQSNAAPAGKQALHHALPRSPGRRCKGEEGEAGCENSNCCPLATQKTSFSACSFKCRTHIACMLPRLNRKAPSSAKMVLPMGPGGKKICMKPQTIMANRQPHSMGPAARRGQHGRAQLTG